MESPEDIAETIQAFIFQQFPLARKRGIAPGASLIEGGIIDSLGILEIVTFIEQEFSIELTDEEMLAEYFDSIGSLSAFIVTKLNGPVSADA